MVNDLPVKQEGHRQEAETEVLEKIEATGMEGTTPVLVQTGQHRQATGLTN